MRAYNRQNYNYGNCSKEIYIVLNFAIITSLLSSEEQELLYIEPMQSSLSLQFGKDASRHLYFRKPILTSVLYDD